MDPRDKPEDDDLVGLKTARKTFKNKPMYCYAIMDKEDGTFGVHFPDFPGCVSVGDTEDEALASLRQATAL